MKWFKLVFLTGDFQLVTQPTLLTVLKLNPLVQQFKSELADENIWPAEFDSQLYPKYRLFYEKIGAVLGIEVDALCRESRHRFFISDGVVEYQGQNVADLSQLEKLMGYLGYDEITSTAEQPSSMVESTGDLFLDLATDVLLIFKMPGLESIYSPSQLFQMCKYANERMRQAEADAKEEALVESKSDLEKEELDPDLRVNLHRIEKWLGDRQIPHLFLRG